MHSTCRVAQARAARERTGREGFAGRAFYAQEFNRSSISENFFTAGPSEQSEPPAVGVVQYALQAAPAIPMATSTPTPKSTSTAPPATAAGLKRFIPDLW